MLLILWMLFSHDLARDWRVDWDTPMANRKIKTKGLAMRSKQPTASFSMYAIGFFIYLCISKVSALFRTALWHCLADRDQCCMLGKNALSSNLCCTGWPRISQLT